MLKRPLVFGSLFSARGRLVLAIHAQEKKRRNRESRVEASSHRRFRSLSGEKVTVITMMGESV